MPDFNSLKIPSPSAPVTVQEWVGLIDKFNGLINHLNTALVINGNGDLGVGTAPVFPDAKLHVKGNRLRVSNPNDNGKYIDVRTDGTSLDIESSKELYINNNGKAVIAKNFFVSNGDEGRVNLMDGNHYIRSKRSFGVSIGTHQAAEALVIRETSGNVGIGQPNPGAKLHILHQSQDSNGNALIIGPTTASNLRLGYHNDYSWIQSHGSKPLVINQLGSNVGIGVANPGTKLHVQGDRIRLTNAANNKRIDLRVDGGSLDIETSHDLYINNNGVKVITKDFRTEKLEVSNDVTIYGKLIVHGNVELKGSGFVDFSNNAHIKADYVEFKAKNKIVLDSGNGGADSGVSLRKNGNHYNQL